MNYIECVNNNCTLGVFPGGSHKWGSKCTRSQAYPSECLNIISILKYAKN